MEKNNNGKVIGSVIKAMDVFELLSQSPEDGLTVTEISEAMDQGVSATYHLLNTLRSRDFIHQDPRSKRYTLGRGVMRLCSSGSANNVNSMLKDYAYSYLKELTEKFNETSNLIILDGYEIEYLAQVESSQLMKMFTTMGARIPFYCTGGGKAIFAFKPPESQKALLRGMKYHRFTKNTIQSNRELLRECELIREQGYSLDNEEREVGTKCVAVPIFDGSGYPVAALSLSCPTYRIDDKLQTRIIKALIKASKELSASLGYRG